VATWFIHELPGEDGSGVFVAIHNELDVILVRRLCGSVCVERGCVAAVDGAVRIDTAEITPVVEEVQNQLDAVFGCIIDGRVETGDTKRTIVDGCVVRAGKGLSKSIDTLFSE
jgi:hypothetical protein